METKFSSLDDWIKTEEFENLVETLSEVPEFSEFKKKAENEIWTYFEEEGEDKVSYEDLPRESKKLIGYVSEGDKEELPWWFESFEFELKEKGGKESQRIYLGFLKNDIQNYHEDSYILPPSLKENHFKNFLNNLHKIEKTLADNLEIEVNRERNIPGNFFELQNGKLVTSDEFKSWFDNLIQFSPPMQEQLTSLLLVYSNIDRDLLERKYPSEESISVLEEIGMIDSSNRVGDKKFFKCIRDLTNLKGIFDLSIGLPEELQEYESNLAPLKQMFYRTFQNSIEKSPKMQEEFKKWIDRAGEDKRTLEDPEKRDLAIVGHTTPLYLDSTGRLNLVFAGIRYSRNYKGEKQRYIHKLKDFLEDLELIKEEEE